METEIQIEIEHYTQSTNKYQVYILRKEKRRRKNKTERERGTIEWLRVERGKDRSKKIQQGIIK